MCSEFPDNIIFMGNTLFIENEISVPYLSVIFPNLWIALKQYKMDRAT